MLNLSFYLVTTLFYVIKIIKNIMNTEICARWRNFGRFLNIIYYSFGVAAMIQGLLDFYR